MIRRAKKLLRMGNINQWKLKYFLFLESKYYTEQVRTSKVFNISLTYLLFVFFFSLLSHVLFWRSLFRTESEEFGMAVVQGPIASSYSLFDTMWSASLHSTPADGMFQIDTQYWTVYVARKKQQKDSWRYYFDFSL